jgi:NADPH:quinone reductase-like Zn-dependent oxidoreductase
LAHAAGLRTIVTSRSDEKLRCTAELGADHTINSASQDVVRTVMDITQGRGVDVVIENIGGDSWPLAMKSLRRGGRLVTCGATQGDQPGADLRRIFIRQLQILGSTLGDIHEFAALLRCVEQNRIQPVIDSEFAMDDVHQALARLESGEQFGKVGLRLLDR